VVRVVADGLPVGIVGAGIVGLAVARQLALAGVPVTVFEKEPAVAVHQTGHNSGVVHAGIYYKPGSAKARMCRRGVDLLREYCAGSGLGWDARGKLVVARDEAETAKLRELERRATANGVPDVRWLDAAAMRELEPDVAGQAALLSPTTAIVDYPAIARSFADDVLRHGGQVLLGTAVTGVDRRGGLRVLTPGGSHRLSRLVICAGLQADLLAAAAGDEAAPEIIPFRGEYLRLRPHARDRVRHLIYPVPDPKYPFLGVHLTPRIDGEADLGPNAVHPPDRGRHVGAERAVSGGDGVDGDRRAHRRFTAPQLARGRGVLGARLVEGGPASPWGGVGWRCRSGGPVRQQAPVG
jgi:L-2-hydroxyglutarate oxidase LhgO